MSEPQLLRDRYLELIDHIVQATLQGEVRSKEQVYQQLRDGIGIGTGEIFENCLTDRLQETQAQADDKTDEFKQAKATRRLRALKTIRGEWERWQTHHQAQEAIASAIHLLMTADASERLTALVRVIDPNRENCVSSQQLKQIAQFLQQQASQSHDRAVQTDIQQVAEGIFLGLASWNHLQGHLVDWVYDDAREIGFEGGSQQPDPWTTWAKHVDSPVPKELFRLVSAGQSIVEFAASFPLMDVPTWVELIVLMQYLQQGMITWSDKLVYNSKVGAKLSVSSFLLYSLIWAQLARGIEAAPALPPADRRRFADAAFQMSLQVLRVFSQRPYFPLYSTSFASFPGSRLRGIVSYLNEPLKRAEKAQEKARIITLIGSSERAHGQFDRAKEFHEIARDLAIEAGDRLCEIANLNHLSRTCVAQKNYGEAIDYSQRALILSRQVGDRPGEANALVNLGYCEVLQAHQREQSDPETYEPAVRYLQQGVRLATEMNDRPSLALGLNSLGITCIVLDRPTEAIEVLMEGLKVAQLAGDLYLQGIDLSYLAEAYYRLENFSKAIYTACIGMYYLDTIASNEWRQPAGLLTVLQGQMGARYQDILESLRSDLVAAIGVDGYDHIPALIDQYRGVTG